MHLYKTKKGHILADAENKVILYDEWDQIINRTGLFEYLSGRLRTAEKITSRWSEEILARDLQAPIGGQELWAAGVTYLRSRDARMEESKQAGGSDFYQKVYEAERPELFFKSLPHRVVGHNQKVNIRKDSTWN